MSPSFPKARASDAHSKIAIPRLAKSQPINNGSIDKPRASRACVSCRQLKMRCSGDTPCQRCTASKRNCAFPQPRKGRLKSVSEQNEHMIKLMKHLRERVTDEDKRQIEDLLERIIDTPASRRKDRNKPTSPNVVEEERPEPNEAPGAGLSEGSPSHTASAGSEFTGKISNLQWLLRDPTPEKNVDETSSDTVDPGAVPLHDEPISPTSIRQTHPQVGNSALLEIFWHLQKEPAHDAHIFLEHVRSCATLNASTVEDWLQDRRSQRIDSPFFQTRVTSDTSSQSSTTLRRLSQNPADRVDIVPVLSPSDSVHEPFSTHVTIATVKRAVDMFFRSTGMLFYIVPKEQLDDILASIQLADSAPFAAVLKSCTSLSDRARLAELCGMAAVGLLYLRISDEERAPPPNMAHYFYSVTKEMLDSAVEANPLRAMKVCALLTLYNIYVKAKVALAYVELGTGLAQLYGLHDKSRSTLDVEEHQDYKRTWRTLLTFNGWLAASLGYASGQAIPDSATLEMEHGANEEDIIQQELVKVTIIKAKIVRAIPDDGAVDDRVIDGFHKELNNIKEGLPEWMRMESLINGRQTPVRRVIMYFHLFFLSAMQLLYRRGMTPSMPERMQSKSGVRDGLMAAKMVARMLALMNQEGYIGQFCWMCIYSSYTSGIIVLQAAVQKILTGYHSSTWIADLALANICINVLEFCAEVDSVAARMKDVVQQYMDAVRDTVNAELNAAAGESSSEDEMVDYLFTISEGDSNLHKAARDLLRLIQHPFGTSLELVPGGGPQPPLRNSLVNWMEAAVGIPQEWDWELQKCGLKPVSERRGSSSRMADVMSTLSPGHFVPMGNTSPWTTWTQHTF